MNHGINIVWALISFFGFIALQRSYEIWISNKNSRKLRALGAKEFGKKHFPLLVLVHILYPILVLTEVLHFGARPTNGSTFWAVIFFFAQVLRYSAILSLGIYWNIRIWVLPAAGPVKRGPYKWLRHPTYAAIILELVAGPMLFGAWRTAIFISILNLIALRIRIQAEEAAWKNSSV